MKGFIYLSGRCNRDCPTCSGQFLPPELDDLNTLWYQPDKLLGLEQFCKQAKQLGIYEVVLTATSTDPLLYKYIPQLREYLLNYIPNLSFGVQTNGVAAIRLPPGICSQFDSVNLHIDSFDPDIYTHMMGGTVPEINGTLQKFVYANKKEIDIVLGSANTKFGDLFQTLTRLRDLRIIDQVNLIEPVGQPYVGDPLRGHAPLLRDYEKVDATAYNWKGLVVIHDDPYPQLQHLHLYPDGEVWVGALHDRLELPSEIPTMHARRREQWIRTPQNPG